MVIINFEEQLQPGNFENAIHHLIDNNMDMSFLYPRVNNDETGRPAYDLAILLKIILFAYSKGITSSREIEWQCQHNIIFKALSCDSSSHFMYRMYGMQFLQEQKTVKLLPILSATDLTK